ncbi:CDP-alcohol phosphatidyltransferase family protein [Methylomicrobium lacus]|uniref:CDP-alcohol phosphatidyltransferase family protein n=1 Tax=Methylomicrobium lacus TaxID=136992 RepID=UPI00045E7D34|nr:CDP-alcohol phosphatidyltransferase family protein [Methylomicrobium lacus]
MPNDSNSKNADRRSVPARENRWSKKAARWLAQANVSPDTISICGVLAALVSGLAFGLTAGAGPIQSHLLWIVAGTMAGLRLICNMLDGMVAVEWGKGSPLGALYNEIPDRIADFIILVGAGYSAGGHVDLGYITAALAVFTAYVRVAVRSVGAPSDFGGPMAKPQRMAVIIAAAAYLGFTPEHWHPTFGDTQPLGLISLALAIICAGSLLTAVLRLRRAARYLRASAND